MKMACGQVARQTMGRRRGGRKNEDGDERVDVHGENKAECSTRAGNRHTLGYDGRRKHRKHQCYSTLLVPIAASEPVFNMSLKKCVHSNRKQKQVRACLVRGTCSTTI